MGYTGIGRMSRELGVTRDRVKLALGRLMAKGKVEVCDYGGIRTYRAKAQSKTKP